MRNILISILFLLYNLSIYCQVNIGQSVLIYEDSKQCTCGDSISSIYSILENDSIEYKSLFHELLCHPSMSDESFFSKLKAFEILDTTFRYWGYNHENFKFYYKYRSSLTKGKRIIFTKAYNQFLSEENYLEASQCANKVFDNRPRTIFRDKETKDKTDWRDRELKCYQLYADDDYIKLIAFHKFWLFMDTTEILLNDPPFKGYDHLVNLIAKYQTSSEFQSLLNEALNGCIIITNPKRCRQSYWLNFKIRDEEFNFIHEDYSRMYMADTIHIDTFTDFHCYSNSDDGLTETIYMVNDTICNKIGSFSEMTDYKEKLKSSLLFAIIRELNSRE